MQKAEKKIFTQLLKREAVKARLYVEVSHADVRVLEDIYAEEYQYLGDGNYRRRAFIRPNKRYEG